MTTADIATLQLPLTIHFPQASIEIVSAEVCASYWEGTAGDYREAAVAGIASPSEAALVHSLHSPGAAHFARLQPAPLVGPILPSFIIRETPRAGKGAS